MSKTEPIRSINEINELKEYFYIRGELRNYVLIILGLNTSLRISDLLQLKWEHVYNFKTNTYKQHIYLLEKKTKKESIIAINSSIIEAMDIYASSLDKLSPDMFLFPSRIGINKPITRNRAYNIIKKASIELELESNIACHSLRKTFGYQAWKKGIPPVLLMSIYNHSSYEITKRYLGITQDERDDVFLKIQL